MKERLWAAGRVGWNTARSFWRAGVGFVYPAVCPLCHVETPELQTAERYPVFCDVCRDLLVDDRDRCATCGAPVGPNLQASVYCPHCRRDRFAFRSVCCVGVHTGELQQAVRRGKCPDEETIAAALAELLWQKWHTHLRQIAPAWVVPVPQHPLDRLRGRHNSAETMARVLARRLHAGLSTSILAKTRRTVPQTSLPATKRRTNLRGAFRARLDSRHRGTTVLLVDDVLTTGTTANAVSRALRDAGVDEVHVAVAARGVGKSGGV